MLARSPLLFTVQSRGITDCFSSWDAFDLWEAVRLIRTLLFRGEAQLHPAWVKVIRSQGPSVCWQDFWNRLNIFMLIIVILKENNEKTFSFLVKICDHQSCLLDLFLDLCTVLSSRMLSHTVAKRIDSCIFVFSFCVLEVQHYLQAKPLHNQAYWVGLCISLWRQVRAGSDLNRFIGIRLASAVALSASSARNQARTKHAHFYQQGTCNQNYL